MGVLTYEFPVTNNEGAFPSPPEVTGVSYRIEVDNTTIPFAFPSPLEVTGVSYLKQEKAASTFLTLGFRPLSR